MARFLVPKDSGLYHYGSDALDGDPDKIAFEEPVPVELQLYRPQSGFAGGAPVSSQHMPTKLRLKGRKRKIPDFSNQYHMFLVNQRFLDVIERFQKEIQTFPIECFWSDGSPAGSYFFFFTTVLLDAVVREKTTVTWITAGRSGLWDPQPGGTFTFDKARMGDTHIWMDPHMAWKWPLVSEELFVALKRADIRLFENMSLHPEI
ncbi:imm11 family protein [Xanthobacter sp.]|uniref:imm11 family protein n=1 Tax=Xanthobacter sp. TaxID=35809 RepID=UPI0035B34E05